MPKVYIRCDAMNRVNTIESEHRIADLEGWILVDEGEGDKYENPRELYLGHHILVKPATMGDAGIPAYYYKFENGKIVERTAKEIQSDIDAIPPPPKPIEVIVEEQRQTIESLQVQNDLYADLIQELAMVVYS